MDFLKIIQETEFKTPAAVKRCKELFIFLSENYPTIPAFESYIALKQNQDPNTFKISCKNCSCEFPSPIRKLKDFCNVSCSMKYRYKDPEYSNRVHNSISESYSKLSQEVLIDRAMKIADLKRKNGSYEIASEKIRKAAEKKRIEKEAKTKQRVHSAIARFGIIRTIMKGFALNGKKDKFFLDFWKYVDQMVELYSLELSVSDQELSDSWFEKYARKFCCKHCGVMYRREQISGRVLNFPRGATEYCSRECSFEIYRSVEYKEARRETTMRAWQDETYRQNQIDNNIERHKNMSKEEKANFVQKVKTTVLEKDPNYYSNWSTKVLQTKKANGFITHIKENTEERKKYLAYKNIVTNLTKKRDLPSLENYEKRGKKTYHLDHVFPISVGFLLGIPSEMISSLENLQYIEATLNRKKSNFITEAPDFIVKYIETLPEEKKQLYENLKNRNVKL